MPGTSDVLKPSGTLFHQLIRYALAGGAATAVTMAVYAAGWRLLARLGVRGDYLIADAAGWAAGMTVNYWLSRRWVFESRRLDGGRGREFLLFAVIGLAGLGWSQLGLWGLVGGLRVHRDLAKVVMIGLVFAWNFMVRRALLFR